MTKTHHWRWTGSRLVLKSVNGTYQIKRRDDGRFDVLHFASAKSKPERRATADTSQGAKDFVAIEVAKLCA